MTYPDAQKSAPQPHSVIMEARARLSVTGVEDVESFDDGGVVIYTSQGVLLASGSELHIEKLSLESGELCLSGQLDSLRYEDDAPQSGGFLSRLFR